MSLIWTEGKYVFPGVSCGRGIEAALFIVISSTFVAAAVGSPSCGGSWEELRVGGPGVGAAGLEDLWVLRGGKRMLLLRRASFCQEGQPGSSLGCACPPPLLRCGERGPECAGGGRDCVGSGNTVWSLT